MKKTVFKNLLLLLLSITLFNSCKEDEEPRYTIIVNSVGENVGETITTSIKEATVGLSVQVFVNFATNDSTRSVSISGLGSNAQIMSDIDLEKSFSFSMPSQNVVLSATFSDIAPTEYPVVVNNITENEGIEQLTTNVEMAKAGEEVVLTADFGGLKYRSVVVNGAGIESAKILYSDTLKTLSFIMPSGAVEIEATFSGMERVKSKITLDVTTAYNKEETLSCSVEEAFEGDTVVLSAQFFTKGGRSVEIIGAGLSNAIIYDTNAVNQISFIMPPSAVTIEATFDGLFSLYSISEAGEIVGYRGNEHYITIPEKIDDITVVSIGENAFAKADSLLKVVLPNGVTSIGEKAFYALKLQNIVLNEGITTIGKQAFFSSDLRCLTIPSTVTTIGSSLTAYNYQLDSIVVLANTPPQLGESGSGDFYNNAPWLAIYVPVGSVDAYKAVNNWTRYKDIIVEIGQESPFKSEGNYFWRLLDDGNAMITGYSGDEKEVTYPTTLGGVNLTTIDNKPFSQNNTIEVINIPDNVTTLNRSATAECFALKTINIGAGLKEISGASSFLPWAGSYSDSYNNVEAINVVDANENFQSIDGILYSKDGSVLIAFPGNHPSTEFTSPQGLVKIESQCFNSNKALVSIIISEGVSTIENRAISGMKHLKTIEIPATVTNLTSNFVSCDSIQKVTIKALTPPTIDAYSFKYCNDSFKIYVPSSALDAYKAADVWKELEVEIVAIEE